MHDILYQSAPIFIQQRNLIFRHLQLIPSWHEHTAVYISTALILLWISHWWKGWFASKTCVFAFITRRSHYAVKWGQNKNTPKYFIPGNYRSYKFYFLTYSLAQRAKIKKRALRPGFRVSGCQNQIPGVTKSHIYVRTHICVYEIK